LVPNRIVNYYTDEYVEADRLRASAVGRLELLRTQELLRRHLPEAGSAVADIGGGTGAHAAWLVADGHDVVLVDLVPAHVEAVRRQLPGLRAEVADARELPLADGCVDAALLLGPLYHLQEPADRLRALQEAVRVTRSGGVVAVAAIGRYAPLLDLAVQRKLSPEVLGMVRGQMATGRHDPRVGFTDAYMHLPGELRGELASAGVDEVTVYAVEGPLWPGVHVLPDDVDLDPYLTVARELETNPDAVALSAHLLGVGTRP
jgi:SAM-dependent methyltransferase